MGRAQDCLCSHPLDSRSRRSLALLKHAEKLFRLRRGSPGESPSTRPHQQGGTRTSSHTADRAFFESRPWNG